MGVRADSALLSPTEGGSTGLQIVSCCPREYPWHMLTLPNSEEVSEA